MSKGFSTRQRHILPNWLVVLILVTVFASVYTIIGSLLHN